jgi:hypothetical protein
MTAPIHGTDEEKVNFNYIFGDAAKNNTSS